MMNKRLRGMYIHVPFCRSKCPYCDFYSLPVDDLTMDAYICSVEEHLRRFAAEHPFETDTVYFGGGTPSLLGAGRLSQLLEAVNRHFPIRSGAEVTTEVNPAGWEDGFFDTLHESGFTRISAGMQSANRSELKLLGRIHKPEDVVRTADAVHRAGFRHFSLDLMTALPVPEHESREENLLRSVQTCKELGADHVSSYILKIEDNTYFGRHRDRYHFPDDDTACDDYLFVAGALEKCGYRQYEISNFAVPGCESRHNLLYWHDEEYLGVGPAAHSFLGGRRFYYPRSLQDFMNGVPPVTDGSGGSFSEFVMLGLRLAEGITRTACRERFPENGEALFEAILAEAQLLARRQSKSHPLLVVTPERIALTCEGFLVSNTIIGTLLDEVE